MPDLTCLIIETSEGAVTNYREGWGLQNGREGEFKFYPYEKGRGQKTYNPVIYECLT